MTIQTVWVKPVETWSDGTPKSLNTAFNWRRESKPLPAKKVKGTPEQIKARARQDRRNELRRLQRAALRQNAEATLASFIPKSVRSPR